MDNNFDFNRHDDDKRPSFPSDDFFEAPPRKKGRGAAVVGKTLLCLALVALVALSSVTVYQLVTDGTPAEDVTAGQLSDGSGIAPTSPSKTNYTLGDTVAGLTTPEIFVKSAPSVVAISSQVEVTYNGLWGQSGSVTTQSTGTGVIMSADGYIITNHHVVEDALAVTVTTNGNQEYEAKIVGTDETTDIAVLKIEAKETLTPAEFGDSAQLVVGEPAIVIGNPLGTDLADTLTQGVISSTERQVPFTKNDGTDFYMTLIQTDAAVNPGNSGGPLINSRGQVVGIINSKIAQEDVEGIGFAIPSDVALSIAQDLIENGTVTIRPMLGIQVIQKSVADVNNENEYWKDEIAAGRRTEAKPGVYVHSVTAGSAAANGTNGGIKENDRIVSFNGNEVTTLAELNYQKEKCKIGETAVITVERGGETIDIEVTFVGGVAA